VSLVIRRITIAVLAAALVGAVLAVPASSKSGPHAVASKKAKKCKKKKKGKKKKGCKHSTSSSTGLPGQATPSKPTAPNSPPSPPILHVSGLSLAANPVFAGNSTIGQVTLDAAAPSAGQQVDLLSSDPSVGVPGSVLVTAGHTTASFAVTTTQNVAATSTLTASIGTSNATTQLSVVDDVSVSSLTLERQCFNRLGTFASNRVSLDVPAPSNTSVSLASSPSGFLSVPSSVMIPQGSTSAFFSLDTLAPSASPVTVTASFNASQASDSATVSATDPATHAVGLSLNPDTVIANNDSTGTVTLNCEAPAGGTPVTFSAADPGVGVPADGVITVPAGELSVDFPITTAGDLQDGQYDISATAGGQTVHATLTIDSSLPT
jgi:hypothetical protein